MFCSCLGYNVRPLEFKNRTSMFILLVNIVLISIVTYNLKDTISSIDTLRGSSAFTKPLFKKLVELYFKYFLPIGSNFCMLYYAVYGPVIIQLLDFYHVQFNRRSAYVIYIVMVILFHIAYLFEFIQYKLIFFTFEKYHEFVFKTYTGYITSVSDYLILAIATYYKYGTYQLLNSVYQGQFEIFPNINEDFICEQIRLVAKQNRKLNKLISILYFNFFIVLGLCYQIVVSLLSLEFSPDFDLSFIFYMSLLFVCIVYPIHFSRQIEKTMYNISQLLSDYHWRTFDCKKSTKGGAGRYLFQASIYRNDLQLNLFDCITLNYSFIVKFIVFIMSYNMIIIQTN